jgi:hypothetical protein
MEAVRVADLRRELRAMFAFRRLLSNAHFVEKARLQRWRRAKGLTCGWPALLQLLRQEARSFAVFLHKTVASCAGAVSALADCGAQPTFSRGAPVTLDFGALLGSDATTPAPARPIRPPFQVCRRRAPAAPAATMNVAAAVSGRSARSACPHVRHGHPGSGAKYVGLGQPGGDAHTHAGAQAPMRWRRGPPWRAWRWSPLACTRCGCRTGRAFWRSTSSTGPSRRRACCSSLVTPLARAPARPQPARAPPLPLSPVLTCASALQSCPPPR